MLVQNDHIMAPEIELELLKSRDDDISIVRFDHQAK